MKIMIIRHGDPDYANDSLTEKGFREAELLAKRLASLDIDGFYCSPLGRARATAAPTLKAFGAEAEILHWLREFDGKITSPHTAKERIPWDLGPSILCNDERYYDKDKCYSTELMANGAPEKVFRETVRGVDELLEKYGWKRHGMAYMGGEDKTIALFCHHGLGAAVLAYLIGMSPILAQNNLFLAPTSVTTLVTETDSSGLSHFRATEIGDTSHLFAGGEAVSASGLYPNFNK